MFGKPKSVEGKCNARLYIGDDHGDNSATMMCQLGPGHEGKHVEVWREGKAKVEWDGCDFQEELVHNMEALRRYFAELKDLQPSVNRYVWDGDEFKAYTGNLHWNRFQLQPTSETYSCMDMIEFLCESSELPPFDTDGVDHPLPNF